MSQEEFEMLLQFFKALGDETRLKILGILANRERSVEELAVFLQLKAPTVSHHLARLKELHLVQMRTDGNTHYYALNADALRELNKQMLTPEKMASLVDDLPETGQGSQQGTFDAWERKVLKDFFEGERLKEIPASRKKRSVVLRWLALQFEPQVMYKEAQVNELLQRYHEDSASLRRELIGEKLMQREDNTYWRTDPAGMHTSYSE